MHKGSLILVLAAATVSLSGCQLFSPGDGNLFQSTQAAPDMSSYFDQRMADGRRHLQANRLSSAITAYRQASYSADHTVEAYNGLAIAFDRLGRRDLAEHYFNSALALAPDDELIARNLARFDAHNSGLDNAELAMLAAQQDAPMAVSPDRHGSDAEARFTSPMHGLVRANDGRVALRAHDDGSAHVISRGSERAAVVHVGRAVSPAVANVEERADYPVRVQLAEASTEYPVRVQIGERSAAPNVTVQVRRGPPNGRSTSVRFSSPRG